MKTVISTDQFANYTISGADDIFIVEHGVTLSSTSGVTIKGTGNVDGRLIRIDGSVTSNDNAIHIQSSTATGGDTVRVSSTGFVGSGDGDDSVRMEVANAKLFQQRRA